MKIRFPDPAGLAVICCMIIPLAITGCGGGSSASATAQQTPEESITRYAGVIDPYPGYLDGAESNARFGRITGMVFDSAGNLFVADQGNGVIRKITPSGKVSTLAGTPGSLSKGTVIDGTGTAANFFDMSALAIDRNDNLYVADLLIRKITPDGKVTTIPGSGVPINWDGHGPTYGTPYRAKSVTVDSAGNVYASYTGPNSAIQKITPAGVITSFVGVLDMGGYADGIGSEARFSTENILAIDNKDNIYAASPSGISTVRKITPTGVVSTLAGAPDTYGTSDGVGPAAKFLHIKYLATDKTGNVYACDDNVIRKISANGTVTTVAGTRDTIVVQLGKLPGSFFGMGGLVVGPDNNLYTSASNAILKIRLP